VTTFVLKKEKKSKEKDREKKGLILKMKGKVMIQM